MHIHSDMSVYSSGRGFWANSCFFLRCASVGKIDTNQLTFVPFISMSVGGFFLFPPSLLSPTPLCISSTSFSFLFASLALNLSHV